MRSSVHISRQFGGIEILARSPADGHFPTSVIIESPHLPSPTPATYRSLAELIPRLIGAADPYAIVSSGDPLTYAQVLWTGDGFLLEYQIGNVDQHFRSVRDDLSESETVAALNSYAAGHPLWSLGLEFQPVEVRSFSRRAGRFAGQLVRPFYELYRLFR